MSDTRIHIPIDDDATYLVSYPKSGNTWMRFIVGNLIYPDNMNFVNLEKRIPYIRQDPSYIVEGRPLFYKSHQAYTPAYKKVIYIVRDPRDVAVSYYYFHLKRKWVNESYDRDTFVKSFVNGSIWYGSWKDNVESWTFRDNVLYIRYEDLIDDILGSIDKIVRFLNIDISRDRIDTVVGLTSADQMRLLEKKEADQWDNTRGTRADIPFVRAAKYHNWQDELSSLSVDLIESRFELMMRYWEYR
jgi:hypothetical protein